MAATCPITGFVLFIIIDQSIIGRFICDDETNWTDMKKNVLLANKLNRN